MLKLPESEEDHEDCDASDERLVKSDDNVKIPGYYTVGCVQRRHG